MPTLRPRSTLLLCCLGGLLLAPATSWGKTPEQLLQEGIALYDEGRFEDSLRTLAAGAAPVTLTARLLLLDSPPHRPTGASVADPRPRPAGAGSLRVIARCGGDSKWADVFVDGRPVGQTPLQIKTFAGVHLVRAARPGCRAQQRRVRVQPGRESSVRFELPLAR